VGGGVMRGGGPTVATIILGARLSIYLLPADSLFTLLEHKVGDQEIPFRIPVPVPDGKEVVIYVGARLLGVSRGKSGADVPDAGSTDHKSIQGGG